MLSPISEMDSILQRHGQPSDIFLRAEWRALAIVNYVVDPALLLQYVPAGTELDSWDGKTFVSLVGFRFLKTRVFGIPFPFHHNFDEVNLRFYVRRTDETGVKRGVVFINEIVPRWAIAATARGFYNERYLARPMAHDLDNLNSERISAMYAWKSPGGWNRINLVAAGEPTLPEEGSHEQFITEHYWGYAKGKNGGCIEYRVEHPPWRVWQASEASFEGDTEELYGRQLASILKQAPCSAFLAEGLQDCGLSGPHPGESNSGLIQACLMLIPTPAHHMHREHRGLPMFPQLAQFTDFGLLLMRLTVGVIFASSGVRHLKDPDARSKSIGMSKVFTIFLGVAEIAGGLGVTLGVLTQLAVIGLILITLGAIQKKIFVWHTGFWGEKNSGWHYDLMIVIMNLVILLTNGGRFVLERYLPFLHRQA